MHSFLTYFGIVLGFKCFVLGFFYEGGDVFGFSAPEPKGNVGQARRKSNYNLYYVKIKYTNYRLNQLNIVRL